MKKKRILVICIIAGACLAIAGALFFILSGNEDEASSDVKNDVQEETYNGEKEEETGEEIAKKTDKNRAGRYSDELFRISLKYLNENDIESDDFTLKSALIVQDLESDVIYFSYTAGGGEKYACYSYDDHAFSEDSQKSIKGDYEDMLLVMKYDDEEYNVYYRYTKDDIDETNSMF